MAQLPDVPTFVRSSRGELVVTPFVFAMRESVIAVPNNEVSQTLWVSFAKLARGEGKGTYAFTWKDKSYDLPCVRLDPGQHVLWGITYRMLEMMLEAVA